VIRQRRNDMTNINHNIINNIPTYKTRTPLYVFIYIWNNNSGNIVTSYNNNMFADDFHCRQYTVRTRLNCKFNIDRQVREKYCPLRSIMILQGSGRFRYNKPGRDARMCWLRLLLLTYNFWNLCSVESNKY